MMLRLGGLILSWLSMDVVLIMQKKDVDFCVGLDSVILDRVRLEVVTVMATEDHDSLPESLDISR
jgi:hypothetical protein